MTHDDQDFLDSRVPTSDGQSPCSPSGVGFFCEPPPSCTHGPDGRPIELPDLLRAPAPSSTSLVRAPLDVGREVAAMRARRNLSPQVRSQSWRTRFEAIVRSGEFWIGVAGATILIAFFAALFSGSSRSTTDY